MLSKYKLLESGLVENRKALRLKIPDIAASLDAVKLLQERRAAGGAAATFGTYFALADQVHARAAVDAARGTVFLWLGANVMLEYGYDEARALLETNLANATQKVDETAEELDVLREQIITTEVGGREWRYARRRRRPNPRPRPPAQVNMARVFNFDVMKRREDKLAAAGKS